MAIKITTPGNKANNEALLMYVYSIVRRKHD